MNKLMSPSPGDTAAAFLERINPAGPWAVASIHPDSGKIQCEYLGNIDAVRKWVDSRDGRQNCYYIPHPTRRPSGRSNRTTKTDAVEFRYHHVDCDLDKLDADHEWFGLSLDERKQRCIEDLRAMETLGAPTIMVDTGGGIQALWQLRDPLPNSSEARHQIEGYNRTLAQLAPGGDDCWDCMHLLRLPGPMNLPNAKKRERGRTEVRARLVEDDGPTYQSHDIVFSLDWTPPRVPKVDVDVRIGVPEFTESDEALQALAIDHDLEPWAVEVIHDGTANAHMGKDTSHSAWMFRAVRHMVRQGVPDEVILGLLLDDQWGISIHILESRHSESHQQAYAEKQVRDAHGANLADDQKRANDMRKDFAKAPVDGVDGDNDRSVSGLTYVRADEVQPRPLHPLWPNRIFVGKLTTIAGMPDQGKSIVTCDIAARVTLGGEWPDGSGTAPLGSAIILAAEDDRADTIVPRLMAAGAAMDRVYIIDSLVMGEAGKGRSKKRMLSIADDLPRLTDLVKRHPDVKLLIIDTINSYIGTSKEHDSFRDSDVRAVLGPLKEWAEEHQIAVVMVTHFKKGGSGRAIDQVMGSLAFTALSRSAWAVIPEEVDGADTGRKLLAKIKQNITAPVDALAFTLAGVDVGNGINAPFVQWGGEVKGTADDFIGGGTKERGSPKQVQAQMFLIDLLADGPVLAKDVMAKAREEGHAEKTLNRAKVAAGAESYRNEQDSEWYWRLVDEGGGDA